MGYHTITEADNLKCQVFALCDQPATGAITHPILGWVVSCQRCADRVEQPLVEAALEEA